MKNNGAHLRGSGFPLQHQQRRKEGKDNNEYSITRENVAGPSSSRQKSPFSLDNENGNVSLMHLTRDNNSVLPVRWGWTTHILTLNTLDFDSELISKLMLAEIKSEISERKQIIQNELNDGANGNSPNDNDDSYNKELGNDKRFFTLSMIASPKVYFTS